MTGKGRKGQERAGPFPTIHFPMDESVQFLSFWDIPEI